MPANYPKRPSHFSHRFLRVLFKSCAALEIGQGAALLLATIVNVEDAKHYGGAVQFFNGQLAAAAGFRSEDALAAARKRAIEAGWLHYESSGTRRAGRYWVLIPEAFDRLDNAPLGEEAAAASPSAPAIDRDMSRSGADNQRSITGGMPSSTGVDPLQSGQLPDNERIISGQSPGPSTLSLPLALTLPPRRGAPAIDPDEQDITSVPRGQQNDTPAEIALGPWVRWLAADPARKRDNRETLRALVSEYGLAVVQQAAEALVLRGDPDRPLRDPGSKCWPDELRPEILARQSAQRAPGPTHTADPAAGTTAPAIVVRAHALLAQHGAATCRTALGWSQGTAPTDQALRTALEREPLAEALVDAFARGPLVVVDDAVAQEAAEILRA